MNHALKAKALPPTPTEQQFQALNEAYQYFNVMLFDGRLPGCILNFSRKKGTHGFMAPERWRRVGEQEYTTHEISLTPYTLSREPILVFSTLVHEQCHLWQWEFGDPSRTGYHNKEWADKMEAVGLMPSDTGQSGGKRTGQHMTHYLIEGGRYERAFQAMPEEYKLPFTSLEGDWMRSHPAGMGRSRVKPVQSGGPGGTNAASATTGVKSREKTKYHCPDCGVNVWGKPELNLSCGDCDRKLEAVA